MHTSCNGCRVLRKGCVGNDCPIRSCLDWIQNPVSQGHATVFLTKYYGQVGLLNLIDIAGPKHLRSAIFRSLLYEACGRIVNPIHGSVGLIWSGSWGLCQQAVDAVLRGAPITQRVTINDDNGLPSDVGLVDYQNRNQEVNNERSLSHESSLSQAVKLNVKKESESLASAEPPVEEVELDLTLGFRPFKGRVGPSELSKMDRRQ
ncbi:hypothetical protein CASFOL_023323 [Castilleja foliolosa]|uniref:LOB domain-containing protein n=1 Tax=Castilleja foliolosa TaxID=1961234 RepID=A0ABD3CM75_9LAMI